MKQYILRLNTKKYAALTYAGRKTYGIGEVGLHDAVEFDDYKTALAYANAINYGEKVVGKSFKTNLKVVEITEITRKVVKRMKLEA